MQLQCAITVQILYRNIKYLLRNVYYFLLYIEFMYETANITRIYNVSEV